MYFRCILCAACLPASLIMQVPISEIHTCSMALMFTLQHEFEHSTLPSIPFNDYVVGLC